MSVNENSLMEAISSGQRFAKAAPTIGSKNADLAVDAHAVRGGEGPRSAGSQMHVRELIEMATNFTRKHPLTALLLALGAGAVLVSNRRSFPSRR